jgi:hypothetical protein
MSIHRSLCIPLPLGRLSQRISRISTHSSGALYPGFSPTTLGPTISSGTHRYAVASPSEVGWVGGWRGAREVAPTRRNSPGGQRSPGHWVANEPGTRGDMTGHRVRWAATKATSAPIIAASRACRLAVSYGPPYCPMALARVTTRHTRRRFVSSRSHPAALRRCCDKGAESRSAPSQFTSNTANRRLATCSCLGTSGHQ